MPRCVSPINGAVMNSPKGWDPVESGRKGGIRSGEVRRRKKKLKEDLLYLLDQEITDTDGEKRTLQMSLVLALIKAARNGSVRAFKVIRDTIGENPVYDVEVHQPDLSALDALFDEIAAAGEPDWDSD